jgi:hypothetical protein
MLCEEGGSIGERTAHEDSNPHYLIDFAVYSAMRMIQPTENAIYSRSWQTKVLGDGALDLKDIKRSKSQVAAAPGLLAHD